VGASGSIEYFLKFAVADKMAAGARKNNVRRDKKGKGRQMDASYEVLGAVSDKDSEGTVSGEETEEEVNGEEVKEQMEGFMMTQIVRTAVAGIGFAMSVVGIWGDGAADLVIIEM
jgi:autophagy-related protein 33